MNNPFVIGNEWLESLEKKKHVRLGEEQLQALFGIANTIIDNIERKDYRSPINLGGSAGTGKSLVTSFIIEWLNTEGVSTVLCAPTHKAALVLKKYASKEASTLHSLLALSPNLDIFKLDIRNLMFYSKDNKELGIPSYGVVICDEASMVNSDLYDLLVTRCADFHTQIIFIDDYAQLNPVKEDTQSKVFTCKNQFRLTKIYRQSEESGLTDILQTLRETPVKSMVSCQGNDGSLIVESDIQEFINKAKSEFQIAISNKDILHTKILAFTNERVDKYNLVMHKYLFGNDELFCKGEILTAYENISCPKYDTDIVNSMDYIIMDVVPCGIPIPYYRTCDGFLVTLYDEYSNCAIMVSLITPDECTTELAELIDTTRQKAINAKGSARSQYWKKYYNIMESFCSTKELFYDNRCIRKASFKYGYAITVHRSQGSSYDNVFIDMKDILRARDLNMLRQLQYVGLSRTRTDAIVYYDK